MSVAQPLCRDLQALGLQSGDTVLVHSSFKALGRWSGTPDQVVDALLQVLGPSGTLLMPSFQKGSEFFLVQAGVVFDVLESPSELGIISETFRRRPGVLRSWSPTHCTAGCGPRAADLLAGHHLCPISVGRGSPYHKLIQAGGKILLLGVGHGSNTTLHFIENSNGAPTICRIEYQPQVITPERVCLTVPTFPHLPGLPRQYAQADPLLDAHGAQRRGRVLEADCRLVDAAAMGALLGAAVRRDPLLLISPFVF